MSKYLPDCTSIPSLHLPSFLLAKSFILRKITETVSVCVCVSFQASSETVEVIFVKLSTVTDSDMRVHLVFLILTLNFEIMKIINVQLFPKLLRVSVCNYVGSVFECYNQREQVYMRECAP